MFTKYALETGMIVQFRDGGKYVVVLPNNDLEKGIFTNYCGYMPLCKYQDDLMLNTRNNFDRYYMKNQSEFDIMRVWRCREFSNMMSMTDKGEDCWTDRFCDLIFDREANIGTADEVVEMTMEEICTKLGKNVKVVKKGDKK